LLPASLSSSAVALAAGPPPLAEESIRDLPVELIDRNPYQTRRQLDQQALDELARSIAASGVLQPVIVRPVNGKFQLIAGERRWLAAQRAGKSTLPAIVRQASNQQAMELTIIENLQRQDLNPMEEARAFARLSREFGLTQEQIAQRTGKDRASVANSLRLLRLPAGVQEELEKDALSFGHAKVLLMLETPETIEKAARRVIAGGLSVRQTEELVFSLLHPAASRKADAARTADPNVRQAERELERALGVRVKIRDRKGKGSIVLEYASLEDFDRILEALAPRRK